jgi:hypothetical protein
MFSILRLFRDKNLFQLVSLIRNYVGIDQNSVSYNFFRKTENVERNKAVGM